MKHIVLIAAVAMLSPLLQAGCNDEPDQLSWEFFSMDQTCLRHFFDWAKKNPPPLQSDNRTIRQSNNSPYVWFKPADKPTGTPFWHEEIYKGVSCLRGALSMQFGSARLARLTVEIPEDGNYRFWMRYLHSHGRVAPIRMMLCAAPKGELRDDPGPASFALMEQTFSWAQQFPHSNGLRPFDPIPTAAVLPDTKSGFRWEGTHKTAFLKKGKYVILLRGGSFGSTSRRCISDILFTADPMFVPDEMMTKTADESGRMPTVATSRDPLYAIRPGGVAEPSAALKAWWLKWRDAFLEELKAKLHSDDYEWGYLASLVYFDERENLIGRADEIAAQRKLDAIPSETFTFEDAASADFTVKKPGRYVVWTREGAKAHEPWTFKLVTLKKGKAHIDFAEGGKTVSRAVVTLRTDFNPRRHWEFPAGDRIGDKDVGFWRAPDPFGAYTRYSEYASASNTWLFSQLGSYGLDSPCGYVWRKDLPEADINRERHELSAKAGEVKSELLIVRNNTDKPIVFRSVTKGELPFTVRLVASTLNSNGSWVPKILLKRDEITLPPHQNTGLWLSIDCREAKEGTYRVAVGFAGGRAMWNVNVKGSIADIPNPWMNPWHSNHMWRESTFEAYRDLGWNMLGYVEVPKATTDRYGIRMVSFVPCDMSDKGFTVEHLRDVAKREREMFGREPKDYSIHIFDEPTRKEIPMWNARARIAREALPDVNIWYNSAYYPTNRAEFAEQKEFLSTWDIACSFLNCYAWDRKKLDPVWDEFRKLGKIRLVYNTFDTGNCENFPDTARQVFNLASVAKRVGLDGWSPHNLGHGWPYDDVYATANTIYLYPGTHGATLTTRCAEAVREANQRWRAEPDEKWRVEK